MNILAIDTALQTCSVGVMRGNTNVVNDIRGQTRGQDVDLAPAIERAVERSQITLQDLQAITVTTGPGSFTGIRVGMAMARGMAAALSIPLIGVTTTKTLARMNQREGEKLAVLIDIKKDASIIQIFDHSEPENDFLACHPDTIKDIIKQYNVDRCITHSERLKEIMQLTGNVMIPDPSVMAVMAAELITLGRHNDVVRPTYIRDADVTMKQKT